MYICNQEAGSRQRWFDEARIAAQLDHPSVVQIHDSFEEAGYICTEMERCRGSLPDWVLAHGSPDLSPFLSQFLGVLEALEKAHNRGIVHRVKPQNLLIDQEGRLKLADFGVAQLRERELGLTNTGAVLGSITFMPPEQRHDSQTVDARADVYGVAGIESLFETRRKGRQMEVRLGFSPLCLRWGTVVAESP